MSAVWRVFFAPVTINSSSLANIFFSIQVLRSYITTISQRPGRVFTQQQQPIASVGYIWDDTDRCATNRTVPYYAIVLYIRPHPVCLCSFLHLVNVFTDTFDVYHLIALSYDRSCSAVLSRPSPLLPFPHPCHLSHLHPDAGSGQRVNLFPQPDVWTHNEVKNTCQGMKTHTNPYSLKWQK